MTNDEQTARGRGRPPKQHRDKLQTREMLLIAGTEVVTEKGFSAVGVDEILQRTGISRCSFYYYFKTKEGFGTELARLLCITGEIECPTGLPIRPHTLVVPLISIIKILLPFL